MSIWFAIFLGLVQGVAEFLPISSSGHLAIFQVFFHMENVEETQLLFNVLLHLGTLVAVCIVYRQEIWEILRELWGMVRGKRRKDAPNVPMQRLILLAIVSCLPLLAVPFVSDFLAVLNTNTLFIGLALLATGGLLYISGKVASGRKTEKDATVLDALWVGLVQLVAVLPGISRSGSTITGGLFRGFDREFAVRYSFLLSIPTIVGANILEVKDALEAGFDSAMVLPCLVGMVVAGVSGYFAIRLVKLLSEKGKFSCFSWYCWIAGALTIAATVLL